MTHDDAREATVPRRVALFSTCMADYAEPGPALAAIEVLEAMGCTVDVPTNQTCCGQPAYNSGFPNQARAVAERTLDALAGFDAVVCPAGSCVAMLTEHIGKTVTPTPERTRTLSTIHEFTQFVVAHGADLELALDATVTYHDSCHMTRILGERTTPRTLLSWIRGLRLVEMVDSDTCCGFGGTFSVKFPDLSVAMADVKLAHEERAAVDLVVSADPGCLLHQRTRAEVTGRPLKFRHIAELTRDALVGAREATR